MDCGTTQAVYFRTRLRFNQYDPIMNQEQSILMNKDIMTEILTMK